MVYSALPARLGGSLLNTHKHTRPHTPDRLTVPDGQGKQGPSVASPMTSVYVPAAHSTATPAGQRRPEAQGSHCRCLNTMRASGPEGSEASLS